MLNSPTVWCERHLGKQEPWVPVLAVLLTSRESWQARHLRAPPHLQRETSSNTELYI